MEGIKRGSWQMRYSKILGTLALTLILPLLMVVALATPALAAPVITLSPTTGAIGTQVTVTGTNFDSYTGDNIYIFFNNLEIDNSPLTIPGSGSFSVNFNIPNDATPGIVWIIIKSQAGLKLAESSFIIPKTTINLDTAEGTIGTTVTVNGKGFHANKTVTFYYHNSGSEKLGTAVATPTGECSYRFTIPDSIAGEHKITAEDARGNSAEAEFEVTPSITLNPASGAAGTMVTVKGHGFGYRNTVTIYFENTRVIRVTSDKYGNIEAAFGVPITGPQNYTVKAEDEDDNTDKAEFTITAEAKLNKTMANIGTELIVNGTGFIAGKKVTVKYDDFEIAAINTSIIGAFSVAFKVPSSSGGTHIITVSDGTNTKQLAFTIESKAPPVPKPLLPITGSKTESIVHFDWEAVDDPSPPITYHLQIASIKDFSMIVLEKTNLIESMYTLMENELLKANQKEAPYYWRVKATDGAFNESDWSTPVSFYVGTPFALPGWVRYTLIGIGVVILGLFLFWLGRKTAYYTP